VTAEVETKLQQLKDGQASLLPGYAGVSKKRCEMISAAKQIVHEERVRPLTVVNVPKVRCEATKDFDSRRGEIRHGLYIAQCVENRFLLLRLPLKEGLKIGIRE
jgi:hypothetical protein